MEAQLKFFSLPAPLARKYSGELRLSGFGGSAADLDVDFGDADRPSVVTALLAGCADAPAELFWELTVGKRIEALLVVAMLSGIDTLDVEFPCSACGQLMETPLPLASLIEQQPAPAADTISVALDDRVLCLKLPTGADLRRWAAGASADSMVRELVCDGESGALAPGEWPPEWTARIEAALSEVDPLVDFQLHTDCPDCGAAVQRPVDLEGGVLSLLAARQFRLLDDIHLLARTYHWSEAEILAMPAHRRRRYLARLEAET